MPHTRVSLAALALVCCAAAKPDAAAQVIGGRYAFGFLALPPSAATTALGGWQLVGDARDPLLSRFNPATLNAETDRVVHVGQDFLPTGVGRSFLGVGRRLDRLGIDAAAQLQYAGFGDFTGRDEASVRTADFRASGLTAGVSAAREVFDRLRVGLGVDFVSQSIESYNSFGFAISGGALYSPDTSGRTLIGLQFVGAGLMLNDFDAARAPLPVDVSIAVSRRLRYLPLRVGIRYRKIDRWNLLYDDPSLRDEGNIFGEESGERGRVARGLDNLGRHLGLNVELGLGKREALKLRAGYDGQRQREGKVGEFNSLAGFSYGLAINTRRWQLDYGHTVQHRAGGAHHLGLLLDFAPAARADGQ